VNRSIQAFALAFLVLSLTAARARADYVFNVTIPSDSVPGSLAFTITSNDNATLSSFGLGLTISPVGSSTAGYFSLVQPTPYADPNYVFAGVSGNAMFSLPFWTSPFGDDFPTSILGGDLDGLPPPPPFPYVTVTPGVFDLGTVQFQLLSGSAPDEQFQITLVSGSNTYFDDLNNNPLSYTASLMGGVVNINISAVPEPSSLVMASISSLGGLLVYRRSRRQGRSTGSL
jgi:hypothetical protein